MSSEGRTKWLLYDQDYTRLLYSCLCWDSHLFKTTTSNISKAQWPHLARWSQSMENSFTTLPRALQRQIMLGWRKETLILPPLFLHMTLLPIFHINTFSISVTPLQEPLYWCTNHNGHQVRSTAAKPVTSHPQDPDNIGYCLPVCPPTPLQWLVYSHSSSASEPKKMSLMQFCCNISPSPVADTNYYDHSYFSVMAEMKHGGVIRAQRPTNSPWESFTRLAQYLGTVNKLALK